MPLGSSRADASHARARDPQPALRQRRCRFVPHAVRPDMTCSSAMARWFALESADAAYFDTAPHVFRYTKHYDAVVRHPGRHRRRPTDCADVGCLGNGLHAGPGGGWLMADRSVINDLPWLLGRLAVPSDS